MSIDIAHLEHATTGDRALEAELLHLFQDQVVEVAALLGPAPAVEDANRAVALHRLRGAAYAVGAKSLAAAIAEVETALGQRFRGGRIRDLRPELAPALTEALDAVEARLAALRSGGLAKAGESG